MCTRSHLRITVRYLCRSLELFFQNATPWPSSDGWPFLFGGLLSDLLSLRFSSIA